VSYNKKLETLKTLKTRFYQKFIKKTLKRCYDRLTARSIALRAGDMLAICGVVQRS